MRSLLTLAFAAMASCAASQIIDYDEASFREAALNEPAMLVEFYAPWCGKCKSIKGEYERAAEIAESKGIPVKIGRIDANKYLDLGRAYNVEKVPTFYFFRNGTRQDFPLLTTGEAFVAGISKILDLGLDLTPAKVFEDDTGADIANWLFWRGTDDGKVLTTLMLYVPPSLQGDALKQAENMLKAFEGTAKELMRFSDLRFAICKSPAAFEDFGFSTDKASLVLYTEHDEGRHEYKGEMDASELQNWVLRYNIPLVTTVWHRTLQVHRRQVDTLALLFITGPQSEHPATLLRLKDKLQDMAYSLERKGYFRRGEFTIGIVDGDKYKSWMKHFSIPKDANLPVFTVEDMKEGKLYTSHDISYAACEKPEPAAAVAAPTAAAAPASGAEDDDADLIGTAAVAASVSELLFPDFCPNARLMNPTPTPEVVAVTNAGEVNWEKPAPTPPPVTWTDIPDMELEQLLDDIFWKRQTPVKVIPPSKGAASKATKPASYA